jgi:hypothetical protein
MQAAGQAPTDDREFRLVIRGSAVTIHLRGGSGRSGVWRQHPVAGMLARSISRGQREAS